MNELTDEMKEFIARRLPDSIFIIKYASGKNRYCLHGYPGREINWQTESDYLVRLVEGQLNLQQGHDYGKLLCTQLETTELGYIYVGAIMVLKLSPFQRTTALMQVLK